MASKTVVRKPDQVRRPVATLLRRGVECVHASAEALDLPKRKVITSAGELTSWTEAANKVLVF